MIAWAILLAALVSMYPWARWFLGTDRSWLATVTVTIALSIGALSLAMLWIGLFGIRIDWRIAAIALVLLSLAGFIFARAPKPEPQYPLVRKRLWRQLWPWLALAALTCGICVLALFNAVIWPFAIDDAIAIYASFGKRIATSGALPLGPLYETYPMLIPLSYAFTHQAAGWINEYLAGFISALLSVGVVGVAALLAVELSRIEAPTQDPWLTGILAAVVIALTPAFAHWASTGYVDLPSGFFYGLCAWSAVRWERHSRWQDALLCGVMGGLAAWTKNSGLLIVGSLGLWGLSLVIRRRFRRSVWLVGLLVASGLIAVAGPWYLRNLLTAGVIIPPTGWTWAAQRTLANLVPYVTNEDYLPLGLAFTAALGVTLWSWRRYWAQLLLMFYIPFFAVWWLLFSYDDRFLHTILPFVGVMTAIMFRRAWAWLHQQTWYPRLRLNTLLTRISVTLLILTLAGSAASAALDHKALLWQAMTMSDADKHRIRLGADRYDMAVFLRSLLPQGSRVLIADQLIPYHADGINVTVGGASQRADLDQFQYWLLSPTQSVPAWFADQKAIKTIGGWRLYAVNP